MKYTQAATRTTADAHTSRRADGDTNAHRDAVGKCANTCAFAQTLRTWCLLTFSHTSGWLSAQVQRRERTRDRLTTCWAQAAPAHAEEVRRISTALHARVLRMASFPGLIRKGGSVQVGQRSQGQDFDFNHFARATGVFPLSADVLITKNLQEDWSEVMYSHIHTLNYHN